MAYIRVPSPMRPAVGGQEQLEVEGANVGEVLRHLVATYPQVRERLFTPEGAVSPYLMIVVDGVEAAGPFTPVRPDSEIIIVPAIGGGCPL